jgi:hypothetical protein
MIKKIGCSQSMSLVRERADLPLLWKMRRLICKEQTLQWKRKTYRWKVRDNKQGKKRKRLKSEHLISASEGTLIVPFKQDSP